MKTALPPPLTTHSMRREAKLRNARVTEVIAKEAQNTLL